MDTILNLGLNDETTEGLKKATSNGRFAWDSYRRFLQMYGDVVMGVQKRHENEHEPFDEVMDHLKEEVGVKEDVDLTEEHLQETGQAIQETDQGSHRQAIPERADEATGRRDQRGLRFVDERSAILYRQKYRIPDEWGTAVNVQSMVFGNRVMTARRAWPSHVTRLWAKTFLRRIPGQRPRRRRGGRCSHARWLSLTWPRTRSSACLQGMVEVRKTLEKNFGDVQDFEFTIEKKKLCT